MNLRRTVKLFSFAVCRRTATCVTRPTPRFQQGILNSGTSIGRPTNRVQDHGIGLSRMFSGGKGPQDDDKITDQQMNEMLAHDTELQSLLKDISKDFDPNPPPPEPPKVTDEINSQHQPHYVDDQDVVSHKISTSLLQRYKQYKDEDAQVILDVDEEKKVEEQEFYLYQDKKDKFSGLNLERGTEGVFELPELVRILQEENLQDIAVITIPKELHYADYLIVTTAKSPRHSSAVMQFLRKLHKLKKNRKDPYLKIEGEDCHSWKVLDMGNIVLHIFLSEVRERYDIDTLWTVGKQFDDLCNQPQDPFYDTLEEEMKFLEAARTQKLEQ